jgi:diguanylate cyclase (GGDEF)-like protein/PAS domain S-box-containing protein
MTGEMQQAVDEGALEQRRLAALRECDLLDTEREIEYDQLIALAAGVCATPMGFFTLVDEDRQWFKASMGLKVSETSREVSFCSHAIKQTHLFVVEDATEDVRFKENPLVLGGPTIRFYAGMPVAGPGGELIGTVCVADVVPRKLTAEQRSALEILAMQVRTRMEMKIQQKKLREALSAGEELLLELRSSELRFRTFMDNAPFLGYMKDFQGRFLYYNEVMAERFRVSKEEWLGKSVVDLWPGELGESIVRNDTEVLTGGRLIQKFEETVDEFGQVFSWKSSKFPCRNEKGQVLLGGFSVDVTEDVARQKALEEANLKLEQLATRDGLTGLLNRRALDEKMELEFENARRHKAPLSVVLLDVDNFKKRNDQFGHASGDQVLRQLGRLISSTMRIIDTAGRYGGEEIVILLPKTDYDGAVLFAKRLHDGLHREKWASEPVTASLGVATTSATTRSSTRLLAQADDAMYEAKRSGKDRIVAHRDVLERKMAELLSGRIA